MSARWLLASLTLLLLAACAGQGGRSKADERITLLDVQGPLLVIRGTQFMPAKAGMKLQRGDQLVTLQQGGAWATLRYRRGDANNGQQTTSCRLPLPTGSQFLVTGSGDCTSSKALPLRKREIPTVRIPLPGSNNQGARGQRPGFSRSAPPPAAGAPIKGLRFSPSQ